MQTQGHVLTKPSFLSFDWLVRVASTCNLGADEQHRTDFIQSLWSELWLS